jgi:hypothetical protein
MFCHGFAGDAQFRLLFDCRGLGRVNAALVFTTSNDRTWGRRVVASVISRLTSSDTMQISK